MTAGPVASWWQELSASSILGSARRPPPQLPEVLGPGRPDATPEVALLDAAALGGTAVRALAPGASPATADRGPAPADRLPLAPVRAVQLLELLVHQPPVDEDLRPGLLRAWAAAAREHRVRAPHHLIVPLLDRGTRHEELRPLLREAVDERGAWLAAAHEPWGWAATPSDDAVQEPAAQTPAGVPLTALAAVTTERWAQLPTPERETELARVRAADPDAGRALVESSWGTDSAADRARLLKALGPVHPSDEAFLERALDDRSVKVREAAASALDRLPGSARAARMADRLRPLLRVSGLLRKTLDVELPPDPDEAALRDGLGAPKGVGSVRGWRLQRICASAPLGVWTEVTGADPDRTWAMLSQRDARAGLLEAVVLHRDPTWAAALSADVWHPSLLALLPRERVEQVALRHLADAQGAQVHTAVAMAPAPWSVAFSRAVLARLKGAEHPGPLLQHLRAPLAAGLHRDALPALESWAADLEPGPRSAAARISQYVSLVDQIPEAFR